ncbi:MAG: NUDIX domain-containing protein [Kofleriaceae bacterium]
MLREAASVILLRRAAAGYEVFLLRRRKGASFMGGAFVFPGGGAEAGEDPRACAARELFEEAGVLLARPGEQSDRPDRTERETLRASPQMLAELRRKVLEGASATALLNVSGLAWWVEVLAPWSHWVTPSLEPRRFSAQFFVCELPAGQEPQFDAVETVDQVWTTAAEALARSKELRLPPPQVRTLWELAQLPTIDDVLATARNRGGELHPILPRFHGAPAGGDPRPTLLLPWDPEYDAGTGEGITLPSRPSWARGPSRFVLEDRTWKHVAAPGSTTAD